MPHMNCLIKQNQQRISRQTGGYSITCFGTWAIIIMNLQTRYSNFRGLMKRFATHGIVCINEAVPVTPVTIFRNVNCRYPRQSRARGWIRRHVSATTLARHLSRTVTVSRRNHQVRCVKPLFSSTDRRMLLTCQIDEEKLSVEGDYRGVLSQFLSYTLNLIFWIGCLRHIRCIPYRNR